jgi:hypothetical protein
MFRFPVLEVKYKKPFGSFGIWYLLQKPRKRRREKFVENTLEGSSFVDEHEWDLQRIHHAIRPIPSALFNVFDTMRTSCAEGFDTLAMEGCLM